MAQPERFRYVSVYRGGKLIATMTSNTFAGASGDEAQIAEGGYLGHSDGAATTKLTVDTVEPVRQSDSTFFIESHDNKEYLQMTAALIGGKVKEMTMRCVSYEISSESASGKQTGKFEFEGGPAVTSSFV